MKVEPIRRACGMIAVLMLTASPAHAPLYAQEVCIRILEQDSTLNNLVDPAGYRTAPLGTLGGVQVFGSGPQDVIFIPGLGFGGEVIEDYANIHALDFTTYAVTLAGFGGTAAPPSPPDTVSFGEQPWTEAAIAAIERLMDSAHIERPILMGHWLTGTQIALRLALRHPDKVRAIVIVSGAACFVASDTSRFPMHPPLAFRARATDEYMAPKWFKTVTRETWDDNNFLPGDYAVNPVRGLRLWRQAASPLLHVWVRYLCEFNVQDISLALDSLVVPTLLLMPGLEGNYADPRNDYMRSYCRASWEASAPGNARITMKTVPDARVFIWLDQPDRFDQEVAAFLAELK